MPGISSGGCGARILVVDDDDLVRDVTMRRLTSLGYRPLAAASGAAALDVLSDSAEIDLLLTDIVMPGDMHGVDLAREAQRLRPQIKILFASGYLDEGLLEGGPIDGGLHVLMKPCTKAELAEKVREILQAV